MFLNLWGHGNGRGRYSTQLCFVGLIMRKVLWAVDSDLKLVVNAANYIRAQAICIRTSNKYLKQSMSSIKRQGIDVYGWRWPGVIQIDPSEDRIHIYAMNEAAYVHTLIDEGLDGYIADPECDNVKDSNCWNNQKPLAAKFCDAIKLYGRSKNSKFFFGTTSGGEYPTYFNQIPWSEFISHSDVAFPQCYWIGDHGPQHGGTPEAAYDKCVGSWKRIVPATMPITPIIGQVLKVKAVDIANFQKIIDLHQLAEVHFYTFEEGISQDRLDAMRFLGTNSSIA
jgi:hypothetical protein